MMELQGSVALVTGGAHRLGRAIVLALGQAGVNIIVHYHRSADPAQAVLRELETFGVQAEAVAGDLSRVSEVERLVDIAVERWGRLDVLVNNAGIWGSTPIGTVTEARWNQLIDTNLRSAFFAAQRAAPALRATGGAIVNIADIGALRPWRNHTPYLISKGGIVTLTEALAKDLAPHVRVNAVAPGPVLLPDDWTPQQAERATRNVPLKRLGRPEDVAQAVLYLAQADYVTGVVLPVDGGQRLS
ncbi:MAG TPA: SDR family oxidoreductase [Roseiflexaceae bacterium]|nr:SDR family oxidoreductase [Roseiflexaceae bacterium]